MHAVIDTQAAASTAWRCYWLPADWQLLACQSASVTVAGTLFKLLQKGCESMGTASEVRYVQARITASSSDLTAQLTKQHSHAQYVVWA